MTDNFAKPGEYRASNGVAYRIVGRGKPLLLLHGLLATGEMFSPLVSLLQNEFCMIIPDLRGHGKSGKLSGPYDVATMTADLDAVLSEGGFQKVAVLGYSHGGTVAQQLAHTRPARVSKLMPTCTYACNAGTLKERIEAYVLITLLTFMSPKTLVNLIVRGSESKPDGEVGLTPEQARWLRALMATNKSRPMRGAARELINFDSRPWLNEIKVPTLVIGGTHDTAVPQYHFDTLVKGIPGAQGWLIGHAGHTLIWTHTKQLADLIRSQRLDVIS